MHAPRPPPVSEGNASADRETQLLAYHGELMDSQALADLFKFGSDRAFRRCAVSGVLPVSVFRVRGRRGWYARTRDVAAWLARADKGTLSAIDQSKIEQP